MQPLNRDYREPVRHDVAQNRAASSHPITNIANYTFNPPYSSPYIAPPVFVARPPVFVARPSPYYSSIYDVECKYKTKALIVAGIAFSLLGFAVLSPQLIITGVLFTLSAGVLHGCYHYWTN